MTTFAISNSQKNEHLDNKLIELYGEENVLIVDDTLRFVVSEKDVTAEDVYRKITDNRVNENNYGRYIVLSITSYFGFHSTSVWSWLKAKGV